MCTSTELCFCHEQVSTARGPKRSAVHAQHVLGRARLELVGEALGLGRGDWQHRAHALGVGQVSEEQVGHRVGAQPQPQRLERDDLVGRDVAEVDLGAEMADEPGLLILLRRLEEQVVDRHLVHDLVDQAGAHLAAAAEDAGGAALARLGDHLGRARLELLLDPRHPLVGREDALGVLRADLGQDDELLGERRDQLELGVALDLDRAVGDLDVGEAEALRPALELVHPAAGDGRLEQRAAAHDRDRRRLVGADLLAQVAGHVRRAPAHLDDVDVVAGRVDQALDLVQAHALVDHVRPAPLARLGRAHRQSQELLDHDYNLA